MEKTLLGPSDLEVTKIGLGAWQFGEPTWGWGTTHSEKEAIEIIHQALDLGINWIDTAEVYGNGISEEVVAKALKHRRKEVVIATKVSGAHLRPVDIQKALEGSLKRLKTDYIDLYQIHWPHYYVPLQDTMATLSKRVDAGQIRYVGVSNFPVSLLKEASKAFAPKKIITNQVRYNLLQREIEKEVLPYCRRRGIHIIAYSPLAQGVLTGKYHSHQEIQKGPWGSLRLFAHEENFQQAEGVLEAIQKIAQERGVEPAQVALRWLIQKEGVVAIPGAKSIQQLIINAGASGWSLSREEMKMLDISSAHLSLTAYELSED